MNCYGILREIQECADVCRDVTQYWFKEENGPWTSVFDTGGCPFNIRVLAQIEDGKILSWEYAEPLAQLSEQLSDIRVAVIVPVGTESLLESSQQIANWLSEAVQDDLRMAFQGRRNIVAHGLAVISDSPPFLMSFNFWENADALREAYDGFEPTHWLGYGGMKSGIRGEALVGGNTAWVYGNGGARTAVHEVGHNLGRAHSNSKSQEYGDKSCCMGYGTNKWNALSKHTIAPFPEKSLFNLPQGFQGDVFLAPIECSPSAVQPGEHQIVIMEHGEERYPLVLSTRKYFKQHFHSNGKPEDGMQVYIHEPRPKSFNPFRYGSTILNSLKEGETDFGVTNHGEKDGVIRVSIGQTDNKPWPKPAIPRGIDPGHFVSRVWNDPRYKYQGLDLWWTGQEGQEIVGTYFTHGVEGGRIWFYLECHVNEEGIIQVKISKRTSNGMEETGNGFIRFDSEDRALFRYYMKEFGRDQLELQAATSIREGGLTGWYSTGDHEGITVGQYIAESNPLHVVYFYHSGGWEYLDGTDPRSQLTNYALKGRNKWLGKYSISQGPFGRFDGTQFEFDGVVYNATQFL